MSNLLTVFLTALKLGVTSFGGPVAHIGYFRDEYVARRGWLDDKSFADLVALCQLLPGPASSQLGIAIGTLRAGRLGGIAAWLGFTLPSALLLIAFAYGVSEIDTVADAEWLHGLKLAVVAVVALAVWSMAGSIWHDRNRVTIGIAATVVMLLLPGAVWQIVVILGGGIIGLILFSGSNKEESKGSQSESSRSKFGVLMLVIFFVLLAVLPVLADLSDREDIDVFENFYRSGSLVFGGGHVVLPLLHAETVEAGYIDDDQFVAGYAAAQAIPGPLFTFSSYLGSTMNDGKVYGQRGVSGLVALVAIFLPSFLLIWGVLPFWQKLSTSTWVRGAVAGINSVVVGLLLAALYDPIWSSSVITAKDFGLVLVLFGLLAIWKVPPWAVVIIAAIGGYVIEFV